ncbi:MAG: HlyD family efflux transporter periplasmic adaptor subunit [Acetobacteraceae bacterium]|nr:HlyD family efflux transporter periplasmic adaptor subunit [Pseudomonadota bacterium]
MPGKTGSPLTRHGGTAGSVATTPAAAAPLAAPPAPAARATLFRPEVLAFQQQNRQWGRVVPLQPLPMRMMVWFTAAVASGVIVFLFVAQYARKEVAQGYLAPLSGSARIFATQVGTISAVYVRQGEDVQAGQPLLSVATAQFAGSGDNVHATILANLEQQRTALTRKIADEVRRTESERARLTAQMQEHQQVLRDLQAQAATQKLRIAILEKAVETGALLRGRGLVSELDQNRRQEQLLEQQQALLNLMQQTTTREGQLSEVKFNLAQLPFAQGDRIQALRNELATTEQRIAETGGRAAYIVRAPVAGRVALLQAGVGQIVDPKRVQLEIVPPDSPLQARLFIPVRAIGFVETGQDVRLLFDAFPYQRFGTYRGRITSLSQTVLLPSDTDGPVTLREPAYAATVALERPDITANGRIVPLRADMSLRADILLEKRTLIDWIVSPLRHLRIDR